MDKTTKRKGELRNRNVENWVTMQIVVDAQLIPTQSSTKASQSHSRHEGKRAEGACLEGRVWPKARCTRGCEETARVCLSPQ